MMKVACETEEEYYLQLMISQKLKGNNLPPPRCNGTILQELSAELNQLREEFILGAGRGDGLYHMRSFVYLQYLVYSFSFT